MNKATMDKKITKIEQNVAAQAIIPPLKVYFFMQGREVESEAEGREINRLFFQWAERVVKALESKSITLEQVLDEIPEPYRTGVIDALLEQVAKEKQITTLDKGKE